MPKDDLKTFKADLSGLKILANALQATNRFMFLNDISEIENWIKVNHANKKIMRSAKNRIQTLKSKIENSR